MRGDRMEKGIKPRNVSPVACFRLTTAPMIREITEKIMVAKTVKRFQNLAVRYHLPYFQFSSAGPLITTPFSIYASSERSRNIAREGILPSD